MGWDTEFFSPQETVLGERKEADRKASAEKKVVKCADCNSVIGVISTTIYEIDDKQYCSSCYSTRIIKLAVERDHSDIQEEKKARK